MCYCMASCIPLSWPSDCEWSFQQVYAHCLGDFRKSLQLVTLGCQNKESYILHGCFYSFFKNIFYLENSILNSGLPFIGHIKYINIWISAVIPCSQITPKLDLFKHLYHAAHGQGEVCILLQMWTFLLLGKWRVSS